MKQFFQNAQLAGFISEQSWLSYKVLGAYFDQMNFFLLPMRKFETEIHLWWSRTVITGLITQFWCWCVASFRCLCLISIYFANLENATDCIEILIMMLAWCNRHACSNLSCLEGAHPCAQKSVLQDKKIAHQGNFCWIGTEWQYDHEAMLTEIHGNLILPHIDPSTTRLQRNPNSTLHAEKLWHVIFSFLHFKQLSGCFRSQRHCPIQPDQHLGQHGSLSPLPILFGPAMQMIPSQIPTARPI